MPLPGHRLTGVQALVAGGTDLLSDPPEDRIDHVPLGNPASWRQGTGTRQRIALQCDMQAPRR